MMVASAEPETRSSLPCRLKVMTVLMKSRCSWVNRRPGFRVWRSQDQIVLSQQPANTVWVDGDMAREVSGASEPK